VGAHLPCWEAGKDNVVFTNATDRKEIAIRAILRGLVILVQHLLCSGKLDAKGAYPSAPVLV
jgi:hypothetical protein